MKDPSAPVNLLELNQLAYKTLLDLSTEKGINASGREDIFGCIFGRDSFITILKILKAYQKSSPEEKTKLIPLLEISKRTLLTLISLQGKEINIESGEQPGKFIHEFRTDKFHHLTESPKPWFLYPDGVLKNYDSIDSTPLALITIYKYWQATKDDSFLLSNLPSVKSGLNWIINYGDLDNDFLIEYIFHKDRKYGGLTVQSWTDSHESLIQIDGSFPKYPIAPVEAQTFAWLALNLWANYYQTTSPYFARKLLTFGKKMKKAFNQKFLLKSEGFTFAAQALDGDKKQIKTITSNPLLALWSHLSINDKNEAIIDKKIINQFVKRAFLKDLFVSGAGIRTMSSYSSTFNPKKDSYHNGSFWPMLNGLITEGLENFGFIEKAQKLKHSTLLPIYMFGSPIELYTGDEENLYEFLSSSGQTGCKHQAWSAATILEMTI